MVRQTEGDRYLTLAEVAKRFRVHPDTLWDWARSGKTCLKVWVPSHLIGKTQRLFLAKSVDEFEQAGLLDPVDYDGEVEISQASRNKNTAVVPQPKRVERKGGGK